ncbi:hypothetical protein [Oerskovia jenensis]|uniref:hypothetical protein n=1 Tax=Oerskovia jenensis TaxID=162169 RepID=UPI0036D8932D
MNGTTPDATTTDPLAAIAAYAPTPHTPASLTSIRDQVVREQRAVRPVRAMRSTRNAPSTRPRRALVGAAATGALAVTAVLALPWIGHDDAYASWTPVPSVLTGSARSIAETACGNDPALTTTVLAEQRGAFTFTLRTDSDSDSDQIADCLVDDDGTGSGSTRDLALLQTPADQQALVATYVTTWNPDNGHATAIYGPAGDAVTAVTITRSNGYEIRATVSNGWWAAWWPGDTDPDATLTTHHADGTSSDPISINDPDVDDRQ